MKLQINDKVRLRLTPVGKRVHEADHAKYVRDGYCSSYEPPTEDADGWSEWRLWEMMQMFGPYTCLGADACFDPIIELVAHDGASAANRQQVGGSHYIAKKIQPWDYIAANGLGYFEGSIVTYVTRWPDKGGIEDLRKARHYLDKLIEMQTADAYPEPLA